MKIFRKEILNLKANQPVIMTIGNFDGVHLGHRALLQHVQKKANEHALTSLVVTFANHPFEFFKPHIPFYSLTTNRQKCHLIKNCGIQYLQIMEFNSTLASQTAEQFFLSLLKQCSLKYVVLGHDAVLGQGRLGTKEEMYRLADKYQFNVSYLPPVLAEDLPISSSTIRKAIANGDFKATERRLGRKYGLAIEGRAQKAFTVNNIRQSLPPEGNYTALLKTSREALMPATIKVNSSKRCIEVQLDQLFSGPGEILF